MRVSRAERTGNYLVLLAFAVFALTPILTILAAALGPDDAAGGATSGGVLGLHPGNFAQAWDIGRFGSYLRTSLLVSTTVVLVCVVGSVCVVPFRAAASCSFDDASCASASASEARASVPSTVASVCPAFTVEPTATEIAVTVPEVPKFAATDSRRPRIGTFW